jgi:hypothetical protein
MRRSCCLRPNRWRDARLALPASRSADLAAGGLNQGTAPVHRRNCSERERLPMVGQVLRGNASQNSDNLRPENRGQLSRKTNIRIAHSTVSDRCSRKCSRHCAQSTTRQRLQVSLCRNRSTVVHPMKVRIHSRASTGRPSRRSVPAHPALPRESGLAEPAATTTAAFGTL